MGAFSQKLNVRESGALPVSNIPSRRAVECSTYTSIPDPAWRPSTGRGHLAAWSQLRTLNDPKKKRSLCQVKLAPHRTLRSPSEMKVDPLEEGESIGSEEESTKSAGKGA
jgi:hypothetical protein